jgi:hypothetical protein
MTDFELFMNAAGILGMVASLGLGAWLIVKWIENKQMAATIQSLKYTLDEMDGQAKLVVRTDIELNRAQEELDKKITGLYALQTFPAL